MLALALATSLVLSPIVWPHYFLLLLIPLAARHPRFGVAWLVPLLSWTAIGAHSSETAAIAFALGAASLVILLTIRAPRWAFQACGWRWRSARPLEVTRR